MRSLIESRKRTRSRTYQRFTKAGVCTNHTIKEQTVTQAVMEKVQETCRDYLRADQLLPLARREAAKALAEADNGREISSLKSQIDNLTTCLDKVYMDKLDGVLDEADFQRIYTKLKADRAALEQRLAQLDRPGCSPAEQASLAKNWWSGFWRPRPPTGNFWSA